MSLMFVKLLELANENHISDVFCKYSTSSVLKNCTTWNLYNSAFTRDWTKDMPVIGKHSFSEL